MVEQNWDKNKLNYLQKKGVEKFSQYSMDFKKIIWDSLGPLKDWEDVHSDMQLFLETQAALVDDEEEYRDMMLDVIDDLRSFLELLEENLEDY